MKGSVFYIPPEKPFLEALCEGLISRFSSDDRIELYLPNRRSCRTMQRLVHGVFSDLNILPIGDVQDSSEQDDSQDLLPAVSESVRLFWLIKAITKYFSVRHITPLHDTEAIKLALSLERFINEAELEERSFEHLNDIVPDNLSQHWQITAEFLSILRNEWPEYLAKLGQMNPVERRNKTLRNKALALLQHPPSHPVIVAGTLATLPATRAWVKAVSEIPSGIVVLPYLDNIMPDSMWESLETSHPQFPLKSLLGHLSCNKSDCRIWVKDEHSIKKSIVRSFLAPKSEITHWKESGFDSECMYEGITYAVCKDLRHESWVCAAAIKKTAEEKSGSVALVTNDAVLKQMVSIILKGYGIEVDNSAGIILSKSYTAMYMRLLLEAVMENDSLSAKLSLLKHPFSSFGFSNSDCRKYASMIERMMREQRIHLLDVDKIIEAGKQRGWSNLDIESIKNLLSFFNEAITPLANLLGTARRVRLSTIIDLHVSTVKKVALQSHKVEDKQVFEYLSELKETQHDFLILSNEYAGLFHALLSAKRIYNDNEDTHAIKILSPMEARLHRFNTMVLAGLHEDCWPESSHSQWMSESMRQKFGFEEAEAKQGHQAHDFFSCLFAEHVVLTRSEKRDGNPISPSPWLKRFEAWCSIKSFDKPLSQGNQLIEEAEQLQRPLESIELKEPVASPPLSARPHIYSATHIERWMRDPYSIYASHILNLRPLKELDDTFEASDLGNLIHRVIEDYMNASLLDILDPMVFLTKRASVHFARARMSSALQAYWMSRLKPIFSAFLLDNASRMQHARKCFNERRGERKFSVDGIHVTLKARADRIEIHHDGGISIIDYKTGEVPSSGRVAKGREPQLLVEALIASHDGFGLSSTHISELVIWKLGGEECSSIKPALGRYQGSFAEILTEANVGLESLFRHFLCEKNPYLSFPDEREYYRLDKNRKSFSTEPYMHLARISEWLV